MLVSNELLVVFFAQQGLLWSSRHVQKNILSQFFDLGIENPLGPCGDLPFTSWGRW
jgi:hypothetical protein